jgi:hypothetical protein
MLQIRINQNLASERVSGVEMGLFKKYALDNASNWFPEFEKLTRSLSAARQATNVWLDYLESLEANDPNAGGPNSKGSQLCHETNVHKTRAEQEFNAWVMPFVSSGAQGKASRFVLCRYGAEAQIASMNALRASRAATYKYAATALHTDDPQLEDAMTTYRAARESLNGADEMLRETNSFRNFGSPNDLASQARGFEMANNLAGITNHFDREAIRLMEEALEYWNWLKGEHAKPVTPNASNL